MDVGWILSFAFCAGVFAASAFLLCSEDEKSAMDQWREIVNRRSA